MASTTARENMASAIALISAAIFSKIERTSFDPSEASAMIVKLRDDHQEVIDTAITWLLLVLILAGTTRLDEKLTESTYEALSQAVDALNRVLGAVGLSVTLEHGKPDDVKTLNLTRVAACFPEALALLMFRAGEYGPGASSLADSANAGAFIDKERSLRWIEGVEKFHTVAGGDVNLGVLKAILTAKMVSDEHRKLYGFDGDRFSPAELADCSSLEKLKALASDEMDDWKEPEAVLIKGVRYERSSLAIESAEIGARSAAEDIQTAVDDAIDDTGVIPALRRVLNESSKGNFRRLLNAWAIDRKGSFGEIGEVTDAEMSSVLSAIGAIKAKWVPKAVWTKLGKD